MASKPSSLSEPNRVMVSCSLDTRVREALHSSVYSGHRCGMCSLMALGYVPRCMWMQPTLQVFNSVKYYICLVYN